ncbi:PepSY domain-containing protein [Rhodanobacter koreensis]
MTTHKNFILALFISILPGVAATASAQSGVPTVTLDQAVLKVQQETGGKVLSAEQRGVGRRQEYRIKVLTPDGHVRVMAVSSEASKNPVMTPSTKNPPAKSAGSKEKH